MRSLLSRLPLLAVALAACTDTDFELQSELVRVRVLAIRTLPVAELALDPATLALPPPLTLEALAVAPGGRPVDVRYFLCRPQATGEVDFDCPRADSVPLAGNTLDPADALATLAGTPDGSAPDLSSPAVRALLEAGVELAVGYEASDGSGTPEGRERGVRRIPVRLTSAPNRNPVLEDVLVGDAPLGSAPLTAGREVVLRPRLAADSAEPFTDAEGPRTETIFYSWHATGEGEVQQFRSREPANGEPGEPTVDYEPPASPGAVTLYVVARDGREGVGWLVRTAPVAAP